MHSKCLLRGEVLVKIQVSDLLPSLVSWNRLEDLSVTAEELSETKACSATQITQFLDETLRLSHTSTDRRQSST